MSAAVLFLHRRRKSIRHRAATVVIVLFQRIPFARRFFFTYDPATAAATAAANAVVAHDR